MNRVLITGASGFMGGRLCEVFHLSRRAIPRAFIHSTGSVARIGRYPLEFVIGDLTDPASVAKAVEGCDSVVHLARGDAPVMIKGLENVLASARRHGVKRFVHMSSVAIYGNNPLPESRYEEAQGCPDGMEYGKTKLHQEQRVLEYYRRYKLPTVILRPPNVYGPYSAFTTGLLHKIRAGQLAIVDGGRNPCNLVYIDNLIEAILRSLWTPEAVGHAFFVTDRDQVTWAQVLRDHADLLGVSMPCISAAALSTKPAARMLSDTVRSFPRVLLSGEFRTILRQIPLVEAFEQVVYSRFQSLPASLQDRLRLAIHGPQQFVKKSGAVVMFDRDDNIISAQDRTVAHSCEKASRLLGYSPRIGYKQGMVLTEAWLRYARLI